MTYRSWTIQSCRTGGFNFLQVDYPTRQFFSPEDGWQKWPSSHVAHKVGFLWGGWGLRGCIYAKILCWRLWDSWWKAKPLHCSLLMSEVFQARDARCETLGTTPTRPPDLNSPPGHPNHISASEGGFDSSAAESMDWFLDSCRSLGSMAAR